MCRVPVGLHLRCCSVKPKRRRQLACYFLQVRTEHHKQRLDGACSAKTASLFL